MTIDSANHKVVVKGKNANPLKALETLQKKYSRNVELISPKPKPEDKKKKEPEKKPEVYYNCPNFFSLIVVTLSTSYECFYLILVFLYADSSEGCGAQDVHAL